MPKTSEVGRNIVGKVDIKYLFYDRSGNMVCEKIKSHKEAVTLMSGSQVKETDHQVDRSTSCSWNRTYVLV